MKFGSRFFLVLFCCGAFVVGCGDDDDNGNGNGDAEFSGGTFTVTVESVDDQCFDNAMNTVILPEGVAVDLPEPVALPALDALPAETDIAFSEPFQSTDDVPLEESGDQGLRVAGEGIEQTDVDIHTTSDDECLTQLNINAELIATDDDHLTGTGTLTISEADGEVCPVFTNDPPCEVTTTLSGVRID